MNDGARSVQGGLLILVILLPLLMFRPSQDCFLLPKETVSQILILGMCACWVISSVRKGKFTFSYTPLNKPILGFILIGGLSLVYAGSAYSGLRELRLLVSYGLLYFLVINNVTGGENIDRVIAAMLLGGLVSSFYGILQYYDIDFFTWIDRPGPRKKVFSTHGNVHFLASYLMLLIPVASGYLLSSVKRAKKVFTALAIIPIYFCLIITYSRGAWLSLLISIVVMGVIIGRRRLPPLTGRLIWTVMVVVILLTVLLSLFNVLSRHGLSITDQVGSLFDRRTEAVAGRLLMWRVSASMMEDYLPLGLGLGNFKVHYQEYLVILLGEEQNELYRAFASSKLRVHNDYLQVGVELGLVGLGVLGWCIFVLFMASFSSLRRVTTARFPLSAGLLASILAVSFHALIFFPFHVATIGLCFFLVVGFLFSEGNAGRKKSFSFTGRLGPPGKYILIGLTIMLFIFVSFLIAKPFAADIYDRKGSTHLRNEEFNKAMNDYVKGLSWDPGSGDLHFGVGYVQLRKGYYDKAIEEFEKSLRTIKSEVIYFHLGNAYVGKAMFEEAAMHYKIALSIKPDFSEALVNLGNVCAEEGRPEEALKLYERAVSYDPYQVQARLNLAWYWFEKGDRQKALKLWREVLEIDAANKQARYYFKKFRE